MSFVLCLAAMFSFRDLADAAGGIVPADLCCDLTPLQVVYIAVKQYLPQQGVFYPIDKCVELGILQNTFEHAVHDDPFQFVYNGYVQADIILQNADMRQTGYGRSAAGNGGFQFVQPPQVMLQFTVQAPQMFQFLFAHDYLCHTRVSVCSIGTHGYGRGGQMGESVSSSEIPSGMLYAAAGAGSAAGGAACVVCGILITQSSPGLIDAVTERAAGA